MIAKIYKALGLWVLWAGMAVGQGFGGLGTSADAFAVPERGTVLRFPEDHAAHPAYRIEWWYLTANLNGPDGTPYGIQWTLFRTALQPEHQAGWSDPQIWFAHAAMTSADWHLSAERVARGGVGQAGVTAAPFEAWIDDWVMQGPDLDRLSLRARAVDFAFDLGLEAQGPLVLQGDRGYSVKSAKGQASYYYSQPFYTVTGQLNTPDGPVPVTGQAWLDREWSSQPLSGDQSGWDWFSLSFEDGAKLMGFALRATDGGRFTSATWIMPDGRTQAYPNGALTATALAEAPVAGRSVPIRWRVRLPDRGVDVTVAALNPQAWMDVSLPYWEGPVTVTGSHTGRGYLEMT
ncbi:MAG: lipocalin-like domain-containing protein, partial [Primorskyibacter sp.]